MLHSTRTSSITSISHGECNEPYIDRGFNGQYTNYSGSPPVWWPSRHASPACPAFEAGESDGIPLISYPTAPSNQALQKASISPLPTKDNDPMDAVSNNV